MTFRRLSYFVAATPLAVYAAVMVFNYINPVHPIWDARGPLSTLLLLFLALHQFGIAFYVPFAIVTALFVRRIGPLAHMRFTNLSPLVFACWVLLCLFGWSLFIYREPITSDDIRDILKLAGFAVAVGYVYVALLFSLWRVLSGRVSAKSPAA